MARMAWGPVSAPEWRRGWEGGAGCAGLVCGAAGTQTPPLTARLPPDNFDRKHKTCSTVCLKCCSYYRNESLLL
ncbi:hypothetical protein BS78_02G333700 [Paspalum vaginatum]|nr:hypothetical protein BS78_02G333700 [Paspalum vaginatum]